ncbi:MAG TPA: ATP-binding protein [Polyangiaceae bacterium]|nr:ATP-binding protein [Polyangiaceae bacterium]
MGAPPASARPLVSFERALRLVGVGRVLLFAAAFGLVVLVFSSGREGLWLGHGGRVALATWGLACVSSAVSFWSVRARVRLAELALGLLVLDQALWTVIVYLSGGVASGATSLYGITCLTGGLLLGVPGVLAAAISGGVFFSLLVVLLESGSLVLEPEFGPALRAVSGEQVSYYFALNVLALVLVALLASYLAERLSHVGGALLQAERRARAAERLAAMGRLSAGLAHEIRNPLSSIAGAVQILKTSPLSSEDAELCEIVLREAGRLEDLVSDMLDLSRSRPPQLEAADVGRIVSDVVALVSRSGRAQADVTVRGVLPEGSTRVRADGSQLRQLIWNLVRNAVQASAPGGEVRVLVERGARVQLAIEDDGEGIDGQALARIFDASYTTRSHGTGIGLAVVKRIADEHGFDVKVTSQAGQGARFEVDLGVPVADPAE